MNARQARMIALGRVLEDIGMIEQDSLIEDACEAGGTDDDAEKIADQITVIANSLQRQLDRLTG